MTTDIDRKLFIGPRLRRLRRELGLNQTKMAEDLGVSPSYVNLMERNQRPITAELLLKLAKTEEDATRRNRLLYEASIAQAASEAKTQAKKRVGPCLYVERRRPRASSAAPSATSLSTASLGVAGKEQGPTDRNL